MIHEPECEIGEYGQGSCICARLRRHGAREYQRGREDAAKAVEAAWRESHILHTVIAAARGDGEQA